MKQVISLLPELCITIVLAILSKFCAGFFPYNLISAGVLAMLIGIVMTFTLLTAFGFGNLFGRLFKINWKLSNLISATFLFDIVMVILFPMLGRYFIISDIGFGLWTGTAVNDTSSVVAAGYAFSDAAGNYATIVKLTRTLSIVPIVLIFSYVKQVMKQKEL